jgi:hypothetical protein
MLAAGCRGNPVQLAPAIYNSSACPAVSPYFFSTAATAGSLQSTIPAIARESQVRSFVSMEDQPWFSVGVLLSEPPPEP